MNSEDYNEIEKIIQESKNGIDEIKTEIKEVKKNKVGRKKVLIKQEIRFKENPREKLENSDLIKKCKICLIDKPIAEFAIKSTKNNAVKFKTDCLICTKNKSKEFYLNKKQELLKTAAEVYEKTRKKKYEVKLAFNTLEELEILYLKSKESFINNDLKERKRNKKRKNGDGGQNSPVQISSAWLFN